MSFTLIVDDLEQLPKIAKEFLKILREEGIKS